MRNGLAGLLRLDGRFTDLQDTVHVDAMASQIAHRALAERRVARTGPLALAVAEPDGCEAETSVGALAVVDGHISNAAELRGRLQRAGIPLGPHPGNLVTALYRLRGDDFAQELHGAFAIALWDPPRQALLLVRDHVGVRPLFVARPRPDLVLFGSELKALLAHPECPRAVDWLGTLARLSLPLKTYPASSVFLGVEPVAPGTLLIGDARRQSLEKRTYWALRFVSDEAAAADRRSDADIIAGYGETLRAVVEDSFSGGKAALFLSGGIDSIAIAAHGRAFCPETYTVFNQSTWANGDAAVARAAAEHLGLPNHQVIMRRGEGALSPDHWKQIVWTTESASCRSQDYLKSQLAHHAHRHSPEARVLLHGEGSDELIGADTRNQADYAGEESYDAYLALLREKQRDELQCLDTLAVESWFGAAVFRDAFLSASCRRPLPAHPMQRRAFYCLDGLAEIVLAREDRFAAVHGMEARAPFVDHRLIDFIGAIPPRAYPTLYWRKHVLRESLRHLLPDALRLQPKVGFYAGVDGRFTSRMLVDVLTAEGGALLRDAFGDLDRHPVLAPRFIDQLVATTVRDPRSSAIDGLLTLVNLGLLEGMARDVAAQARLIDLPAPPLGELGTWDEASFAALLGDSRRVLDVDRSLVLSPGVELARPEGALDDDAPLWVVVDDQVRYLIDDPETRTWRAVLRRLRPGRSLCEVLLAAGTTLEAVQKYVEEALEFEIVTFA